MEPMEHWTMREAGSARRMLQEEIRERKRLAVNGGHKCGHSGRVRVRMSSDLLDRNAWEQRNGALRIYQLGRPMSRRQFRALPEDLQRLYLRLLRDKHGATQEQARALTGTEPGAWHGEGDPEKWQTFLKRAGR